MNGFYADCLQKIMDGTDLTHAQLQYIAEYVSMKALSEGASFIRDSLQGKQVRLCAAFNIKSGHCGENCRYCSQSVFYDTHVKYYDVVEFQKVKEFADFNLQGGVHNLGLSSSGGAFSELGGHKLADIYTRLSHLTPLNLCGAHGILHNVEEARMLKESGLCTYEHNLQTSRTFYPNICTTHDYEERVNTIRYAQEAGLRVCSGGIIGLGETMGDRIEMALTLRDLRVESVPINILNPVAGTPYGDQPVKLTVEEALKSIAIFRLALPRATLIYGAGRSFMGDKKSLAFAFGMNGIVVGNFLTAQGNSIGEDIDLLRVQGMEPAPALIKI